MTKRGREMLGGERWGREGQGRGKGGGHDRGDLWER